MADTDLTVETPPPVLGAAINPANLKLMVLRASAEELEAHAQQLEKIERESKGACLWKRLESATAADH